jgi:hypothetical protein
MSVHFCLPVVLIDVAKWTSPSPKHGVVRRFPVTPVRCSVLWFDNSSFMLYIAEKNFSQAGIMHTYGLCKRKICSEKLPELKGYNSPDTMSPLLQCMQTGNVKASVTHHDHGCCVNS